MDDPLAVSRQRMVDAVHAWTRPGGGRYVGPSRLKRLFRWFLRVDVNCYFTILTHLSLEPGYTLDYVYRPTMVPEIYARREHEPRRRVTPVAQIYTSRELRELLEGCRDVSQVLERMPDYRRTPPLASHSGDSAYLSHIKTDDSEDGFFQLVLLGIMGAQFYCYDHAAYNDSRIVCTHAALDACVPKWGARPDADRAHREAKAFDLAPHVQMGDEEVMVSVALFTKWGGLSRNTYRVRRAFPHEFLDVQKQGLVRYDCGVWF